MVAPKSKKKIGTAKRKTVGRRRRKRPLTAAQHRALILAIRASALARKRRGGKATIASKTKSTATRRKATK